MNINLLLLIFLKYVCPSGMLISLICKCYLAVKLRGANFRFFLRSWLGFDDAFLIGHGVKFRKRVSLINLLTFFFYFCFVFYMVYLSIRG